MQKKYLAAAVCAGLVLGLGAGMLPANMTPCPSAVVYAAKAQTLTVDATKASHKNTYRTIGEALKAAKPGAVIQVMPGTYREKVTVSVPDLTLVGQDAKTTTIVWNDSEGTPLRPGDTNGNNTTYKMQCATFTVTKAAKNFQAVNLTFQNDYPTEEGRAAGKKQVQAFALTDEAEASSFYGCRFLGRQDTLYANAGRQYYKDCYIEGDVDFIFGQASAAVFENCNIHSLARAVKEDGKSHGMGYVTAPSTLATDKGFLFYQCHLTGDVPAPHYAMLGRPWHPSSEKREVNSAAAFVYCQMDTRFKARGWNSMKNKFGVYQPQDNRLYEYKNTGKGAMKGELRPQIADADAANYTPAAYLGDWQPVKRA